MKLEVTYHGGTRFDITSGQHRIVTDQPVEDGGQDAGMTPVELFVGSLAGCVGYFVGRFCTRHDVSQEGFSVEAEWSMGGHPHRIGQISLAIRLPHRLTSELKDKLLKVAHGCTVHQSLVAVPNVVIALNPQSPNGLALQGGKTS